MKIKNIKIFIFFNIIIHISQSQCTQEPYTLYCALNNNCYACISCNRTYGGCFWTPENCNCNSCGKGTYYNSFQNRCLFCPPGTYKNFQGVDSPCLKCPPGTLSSEGFVECSLCIPGTFQPEEGKNFCSYCLDGQYQPNYGKTECLNCPPGKDSNENKTSCRDCNDGYYSTGGMKCKNCPESCQGTCEKTNGKCLGCKEGYNYNNGICTICDSGYVSPGGTSACSACSST